MRKTIEHAHAQLTVVIVAPPEHAGQAARDADHVKVPNTDFTTVLCRRMSSIGPPSFRESNRAARRHGAREVAREARAAPHGHRRVRQGHRDLHRSRGSSDKASKPGSAYLSGTLSYILDRTENALNTQSTLEHPGAPPRARLHVTRQTDGFEALECLGAQWSAPMHPRWQ